MISNLYPEAHQNVGWPRDPDTLKSNGRARILILALDFEDAPATAFKLLDIPRRMQLATVTDFYAEVSNKRFEPQFEVFPLVVRMPKTSEKYGNSEDFEVSTAGESATHLLVHDALTQIESKIDLYQFSAVIALVTGGHTLSGTAAYALSEDHNKQDPTPGDINNEIVVGDKALDLADVTPWRMLVHELNHLLGIPDLYLYAPDGYWQGHSPGPFGQQGFLRGDSSSDSLAYNRWLLGWISDSRVRCINEFTKSINLRLEPQKVESGGYEFVLIRISDTKVIALESPKNKGFQSQTYPNSLLVYTVDSKIKVGDGPLRLVAKLDELSSRPPSPDFPDWQRLKNAALLRGEFIKISGIVIANRQAKKPGNYVNLTILPQKVAKIRTVICKKGSVKITLRSYFTECPSGFQPTPEKS